LQLDNVSGQRRKENLIWVRVHFDSNVEFKDVGGHRSGTIAYYRWNILGKQPLLFKGKVLKRKTYWIIYLFYS